MNFGLVLPVAAAVRPSCPDQEISDAALLSSIAEGNRQAMKRLFARHNVGVFRFMLRIVSNEAVAEELVSEVFFDVWRHAAAFGGRSQVSTWLLGIARNKALSAIRRRTTEELDDHMAETLADASDDPEVIMQKRQKSEILLDCLNKLSPAHREIIDLVYYHEKSIDEAAEIIDVPVNTVKTRMFYARKQVALMLAANGVDRASL
jgi:RNA polymerase sigma-70 factor, ECF subfamily